VSEPVSEPICPPGHVEYPSQMLADNAVTLHYLLYANCKGYNAFSR